VIDKNKVMPVKFSDSTVVGIAVVKTEPGDPVGSVYVKPECWRVSLETCKDTAIESGAWESYKAVGEAFTNMELVVDSALAALRQENERLKDAASMQQNNGAELLALREEAVRWKPFVNPFDPKPYLNPENRND